MALPTLQLFEPIVSAMVTLLNNNLQTNIDALNQTITDGYIVPTPGQIVPYTPVPSTLEVGAPVIGVWELEGQFEDDSQVSVRSVFHYAVVAVIQNADHVTLVWQLRRMAQAIIATVQADRVVPATQSIMKTQGGVYSVNFERIEPGPVLGDMDPNTPDAPPRSFLSWTGVVFNSTRTEV